MALHVGNILEIMRPRKPCTPEGVSGYTTGFTRGRARAGKYTESNLPKGPRGAVINADRVREVQPLLSLMRDIGSAHGGKTPGQVGCA